MIILKIASWKAAAKALVRIELIWTKVHLIVNVRFMTEVIRLFIALQTSLLFYDLRESFERKLSH